MSLLLRNGRILSCKSGQLVERSWLLIEEGRIKAGGQGTPPEAAEVLDLDGRVVLPGLADSHIHVYALGKKLLESVDLSECKSIQEMQERARQFLRERPNLKYLEGLGWDQEAMGRLPTRHDLDAAVGDLPAAFFRRCHHACVLSSAALRFLWPGRTLAIEKTLVRGLARGVCGITGATSDPEGGKIEREAGEPTGILRESALGDLLEPLKTEDSFEQQKEILLKGLRACVEQGITFVQSNDSKLLGGVERPFEAYAALADEGRLCCRVFLTVQWQDVGQPGAPKAQQAHPSGLLSCDRAKLWTDGGLGASTAAMLEPYADSDSRGMMQMSCEEIDQALELLKKHRFRVEAHAIGDRSATHLVDAFERLMPSAERPVLTHCQFLNKSLVDRMSKAGIIANVQPQFVPSDLAIVKTRVGEDTERFRYSYVWRTLMKAGVHVCGGSDAPVESPSPLIGMADAMDHALHASEQLTLAEALGIYTEGAAFAARAEDRIGGFEPGMEADFVVLSTREELTSHQLRTAEVESVYLRGKLVHQPLPPSSKRPRLGAEGGAGKNGSRPWLRGRCKCCMWSTNRAVERSPT
ncbi:unnamed protein product [Effrenium voratum]|nr:unnamed protein product [Effrenium voratum]